jgi:hypothetical protein
MILTNNDISGLDNKIRSNKEDEDDSGVNETDIYNPNWSLRKCCSKFLDKLSFIFPQQVLEVVKPHLEENLQNENWLIKY